MSDVVKLNEDAVHARLGARVRELREERQLSQAELAYRADINRVTLARIETGRTGVSVAVLARLALAMGVNPAVLIEDIL
ncbi:helix-turn-helix transcriptional regulator [Mycobacteroides abscessus subsp. abscessus]|jgi:transcriptional regulator with XRE-family HTH domain|uniref:helix-turn-helix domain-containing protein n=1 Tax=Mycobacteroides abscessus TaxID=36809 RepID=UPI00266DAA96|nr:helix-turn-helix transcriptional regulator [Mycobacteroides abscessus]MDO3013328.1 helix-turn-helix transcriptional regulator [Mycobacteroides abscessus subsp. abscessus]